MVNDKRLALISFTGSTKVGRMIGTKVASRFGKCLLELGGNMIIKNYVKNKGNNAQIVLEDANMELALKGAVFAAVGTCGQRCTSLRRLIL